LALHSVDRSLYVIDNHGFKRANQLGLTAQRPANHAPPALPLDERPPPAPYPPPAEAISSRFSREELAVARRAYARQMLAILGVGNPAIEAAYAAAPREALLRAAAWSASSVRRLPPPARRGSGDSVEKQWTVAYSHIG
jgi:hypothetical protein